MLLQLREILQVITPLNLTDPQSPDFNPAACKTLHDITRFAHEVSLRAMFDFSKESHFSDRSSRRLVCDVPMQWWIIDLEDGIKEEIKGKTVRLEDIVSIPMLALWVWSLEWQFRAWEEDRRGAAWLAGLLAGLAILTKYTAGLLVVLFVIGCRWYRKPRALAAGFLDGDAHLDLVVPLEGPNQVTVLLGNGDGTFDAQPAIATGDLPTWAVLDRLDGDGNLDLVVTNGDTHDLSIYLGQGDGTFGA